MNLDKIFKKNTYLPPQKDELSFSSYLLMINTMPIIEVKVIFANTQEN